MKKVKDFVSFLSKEFGYDEIVINANWVTHLAKYVKRKGIYGEYDIDAKQMSQENKEKLESAITEPFYTFDDLRNIYADICPEADPEEINAMNLKAMGYTVNDEYIVTGGFNSMKEYLDYLIENNTNLTDIRKKTGKVRLDTYLYEKQSCYDIIMYSANDYITISKLEAIGINKTDIYRFYQEIVALVDDDEYFNYKTIKEKYSYSSILDNLGFDDYFYNRILVFCGRFTWTGAFGTMVFRKNKSEDITKASFVNYFAKKYAPIELADFIHMIESTYGTDTITRDRLVYLFDNEVYYNKVLDMIFENYASFSSYIENY